ncbi:MAG: hypothetical protein K2L75_05400 [Muribaculaceae bacterium]|nr:hypothetical protein [Muribaculaceae bacterium]
MLFFKKTAYAIAVAASVCAFSACGGDDEEGGVTPPAPIPTPDPVTDVLSAEDAKEYVENTASDFLALFNANDQKAVANLADYVAENYGDLGLPDIFGDEDDYALAPKNFTGSLAQAVRTHSFNPISRAAYVYDYSFSDFTGVYEPGRYNWEKTADSNDLIFRFRGPAGNCELKVSASGNSCTIEDYDEDYDETIRVTIPRNVKITLTEGSTMHADINVVNELNINGHSFYVNVDATLANLGVALEGRGSDSQITETQSLSINGTTYQTSTATLNGRGMLNPDTYEYLDEDDISAVLSNSSAAVNIMGNIEVRGQVKNVGAIVNAAENTCFDNWDGVSKDEALNLCRAACNTINNNIAGEVYFGGNSAVQATVIFQPSIDDEGYYWYVDAVPVIKYAADGSTQSFEDALDGFNLGKLERQWESVINSYRRLFR